MLEGSDRPIGIAGIGLALDVPVRPLVGTKSVGIAQDRDYQPVAPLPTMRGPQAKSVWPLPGPARPDVK